ncbi:MAG: patatin-like phospholipase family protein [Deltaproteobacteria bacterium]|nr:patatin-like phospholipase family protein [Deltaproteobacteria bacterium]
MKRAPTLREWLAEEPFGLTLSAGFFAFYAHAGMLSVLEEEGLLPRRLSGASAGALVAGLWAAGMDSRALRDELLRLRREDFWDPALGPGLLRGRLFRARLEALLPVLTFEQCRARLAVSAFDLLSRRTRVLSAGALAPALCASCALPGLFRPVWVEGRPFLDGGVADRPGLAGMPTGSRVLYHLITSRSPWRRKGSAALSVPELDGAITLALTGLARVNPFRLDRGAAAFEQARSGTLRALDQPLEGRAVRVAVNSHGRTG